MLIIGCVAVAQLGVIFGYETFLRGESPTQHSQKVVIKETERQQTTAQAQPPRTPESKFPTSAIPPAPPLTPQPTVDVLTPPIALPILPGSVEQVGFITPQPLPVAKASPTQPAPSAELKPAVSPWNLSVEIKDGRTHLTAKNGKDVTFTLSCDKLGVQAPAGSIQASGKVAISTASIEGDCDSFTILWQEDMVVLVKARLECKLEGQAAELQAEHLSIRLTPLLAPPTSR